MWLRTLSSFSKEKSKACRKINLLQVELCYNRFYEDSNGNDDDGTCPCGLSAAATAAGYGEADSCKGASCEGEVKVAQ